MKTNISTTLAMAALLLACGCHTTYVTVESGRDTENVSASYKFGMLEAVLSRDVDTLSDSSEKALGALRMPVVNKSKDKLSGKIQAYTSDGKDVTINITSLGESVSRLTIVVGSRIAGDEAQSRLIFQKILESGAWEPSR